MSYMYKHLVLGGTFDGLHKGHEYFLTNAFTHSAFVTIGLTSEAYIRRFKKGSGVSPFSKRYEAIASWLRKKNLALRAHIVPLDNKWGPAVLSDVFDAIAVTRDNAYVAHEVNTVRKERGLPLLAVVEIDLVNAQDQTPISSTRIRAGEIDREGHLYLPANLRPQLQQPLGTIFRGPDIKTTLQAHRDYLVITVGDVTTDTAFFCGVQPALAIIDLKVERRPYRTFIEYKFPRHYHVINVISGPGYVSHNAIEQIRVWAAHVRSRVRSVIVVNGEEDLLALPAIAYAPIGSIVYYGQPAHGDMRFGGVEEGLVEVVVTRRRQQEAILMLRQFVKKETKE